MERDAILIFHSIHRVMKAEKVLKNAGLDVRLMPVPRQLSSDCGLSLAFRFADREEVAHLLDENGCRYEELHAREGESYRRVEG
ncbi:MAG: DUF3343 domain-containing protein [Deferrisomatales bacterium]|nr:DUF3343 domain-containing protein [Deferrisomatales bacterium]